MNFGQEQFYIVDDDWSVRRALFILLTAYGFSAETFSSAEDFFDAVPTNAPGCLILDIHLPGLNGWEAQERLADSGSRRPVIFITGVEDEELRERGFRAGAVGCLQKPFQDQELILLIQRSILSGLGIFPQETTH